MPRFHWDPAKNAINLRKHKADFSLTPLVWSDPYLAIVYDRFEEGEHRYHAIGTPLE